MKLKRIWFEEYQAKNLHDFEVACEMDNLHLDACLRRKEGIGEWYASYKLPKGEPMLSCMILRDAQTNKYFVIDFETKDGEYLVPYRGPEASEVNEYAYRQWKRLVEKNKDFCNGTFNFA